MDFELSEEQRLLKDSVERLTTQRYDFETRKKFMAEPEGWSRAMWKQYVELGLTALPFADSERQARYDLADVATTAKKDGAGYLLDGAKSLVLHGDVANHFIVSA